jgi:UDP-glucose-4-epimerase GalE
MRKAVLVVGGAGYVGAHTCKALARRGYRPVTLDNLSTGHRDFVRWGPFCDEDIRHWNVVAALIEQHGIDTVMHFAACALVGESVVEPEKYYDNNVAGTLSLLRAMRQAGCSQIVFSSTCAVYGEPHTVPIREDTVPSPVNPYGASKLMVERILGDYGRAYGMRWIALRYFNACGADPEGEIGELRDPETHLIPRAMMAIQGYVSDFQVHGGDYPTADGTAVRDYVHVVDLADAHVAAVDLLAAGHGGGAFNLGTGHGHSVKAVLDGISRVTGQQISAAQGPRRPGDPATLVADPARAMAELGFSPKMSDLDSILRTAWNWHLKAHPHKQAPARSYSEDSAA